MKKMVLREGDEGVRLLIHDGGSRQGRSVHPPSVASRSPIHVVYGGAHLFSRDTAAKLGSIALRTLDSLISDHLEFTAALGMDEHGSYEGPGKEAGQLARTPPKEKDLLDFDSVSESLFSEVYARTRQKLIEEPVEDLRIDFEDGYGFRSDEEEDLHAKQAALELAASVKLGTSSPFTGVRIKSYSLATRRRAKRTLRIFLRTIIENLKGPLPENFVVTLPKVSERKQVGALSRDLRKFEKEFGIKGNSIGVELMVEDPRALIDNKGFLHLRSLAEAAEGRCVAAHFGAYDYTASIGIAAAEQDINHPACDFARNIMLLTLRPAGIRLSDSITARLPVPVYRDSQITKEMAEANRSAILSGWRLHYSNVTRSLANGFYQSWDLHPNQLVPRYAAVYRFFLVSANEQGRRLRAFVDAASQATLTGTAFDDAATALGIVKFFRLGLDCGALREHDVAASSGLSIEDLKSYEANGFQLSRDRL
ncbi:MAG TPA: aldolase/citrate lyase family protein [Pyrinomonadaceae bacterium]|nr:aldolase/citrate lyase family protein [Pyrinomonadaceae bacterium]